MQTLKNFVDIFLHLDTHLAELIKQYGTWTYVILFTIIFCETGLVIFPLLPGDSLLFAAGAFAAIGAFDPILLGALLIVAAIAGDTVNYWIGSRIGERAFSGEYRFLKREYLDRTRGFYARHGGKTIIMARFVPIVRTFAPFVAGVGEMNYGRFILYNVSGAVIWVVLLVGAGYFFGNIEFVKKNFELVIFGIIGVSVLPIVIEMVKAKLSRNKEVA